MSLKVWADFKNNIKSKLRQESQSINATGGGKPKKIIFNDIEEKVIEILQLKKTISGIENAARFGFTNESNYLENMDTQTENDNFSFSGQIGSLDAPDTELVDYSVEQFHESTTPATVRTPRKRRAGSSIIPPSVAKQHLLQQQVSNQSNYQEQHLKILGELNNNLIDTKNYLKRIADNKAIQNDLLKKKIELRQQEMIDKSRRHLAILELKKRKVEILEIKLKSENDQ